MARPTKYNAEILAKSQDYLINFNDHGDVVPSIAGLSLVVGVGRQTLKDWAKNTKLKEFSTTLEEIKAKQEKLLINKGLTSEFNSNITKLMLGNHGYTDKTDLGSDPDRPLKTESTVKLTAEEAYKQLLDD